MYFSDSTRVAEFLTFPPIPRVQDSILAALTVTNLTYFRLTLSWDLDDDKLEVDGPRGIIQHEPTHAVQNVYRPTTPAVQALDPTVYAQRIMECVSTIKTIVLEWDHRPRPGCFIAMVEEEDGVQMLQHWAAPESKYETEDSWSRDLPPDQYGFPAHW